MVSSRPAPVRPGAFGAGRPRYSGLLVVAALHGVALWALSAGLLQRVMPPKAPDPQLTPVVEAPPQRAPEPAPMLKPRLEVPVISLIPPPEPLMDGGAQQIAPAAAPAPLLAGPAGPAQPGATSEGAASGEVAANARRAISNGPLCVDMPAPTLPTLAWSGQAVLQAQAVVQGGRVVAADIRVLQGSLDPRTRRALTQAVQTALAGYRCPGEQRFEQEFSFKVD